MGRGYSFPKLVFHFPDTGSMPDKVTCGSPVREHNLPPFHFLSIPNNEMLIPMNRVSFIHLMPNWQ